MRNNPINYYPQSQIRLNISLTLTKIIMKNYSRILLISLVLTLPLTTFGQIFGIKAGMNLSNMVLKMNDETLSQDFKMNLGYNVGGTVEFPISEWFSIESELLLSTKGYKISEEESYGIDSYKYERKLNLLYLNIPVTGKAKVDVGKMKIYGELGPYFGFGLSGKAISKDTYNGETTTVNEKIEWGNDAETDYLKRPDFGLTFGAGVIVNAFQFGLNYDLGMLNLLPDTSYDTKLTNRVLGISIGYQFSGK